MERPHPPFPRPEASGDWPWLDRGLLIPASSARVCMTCHWFCHHSAPHAIPQLACAKHQALLAHGEHLTHRCGSWSDSQERQGDWAAAVA